MPISLLCGQMKRISSAQPPIGLLCHIDIEAVASNVMVLQELVHLSLGLLEV